MKVSLSCCDNNYFPIPLLTMSRGKHDDYVLNLLRQAQPTEKEIQTFIQLAKSDIGQEFSHFLKNNYKIIPYGSSVTGLFTNGKWKRLTPSDLQIKLPLIPSRQ